MPLICIVAITEVAAIDDTDMPSLPNDEYEAHRMLAEGTLDSALWRKVEQFYTAPLCVPRGELRILRDCFPALSCAPPIDPAILSKYEPWDSKSRRCFFSDFPELLPFQPILSFEYATHHAPGGHAGFYYSRPGMGDTTRYYTNFTVNGPGVEANGRIDFSDAYGKWHRRAFSIAPARHVEIAAGNFTTEMTERLFFGYFPSCPDADSLVLDNWRYGSSRSWNGVRAAVARGQEEEDRTITAEGEAFVHARPTERIGGLNTIVSLSEHGSVSAGASLLTTIDSTAARTSDFPYIYSGIEYTITPAWTIELRGGADARRPTVIPWYFSWSHRSERFECNGTLTDLPKGFHAPRGETGRIALNRCAMGDTATEAIIAAELFFRHTMTDNFTYEPRLHCIFADDNPRYLSAAAEVRGKKPIDFRLSYSWSAYPSGGEYFRALHREVFQWSLRVGKTMDIECIQNALFALNGYWRNRVMISPCFYVGSALRIVPLFSTQRASNTPWETRFGIRHTLQLYNKTFSELTIEQSPPLSSLETIHAHGKMAFLF